MSSPPELPTPPESGEGLAFVDGLTGLANRRYLTDLFETKWEKALHEHGNLAILMLDLDGFKPVNDRHGHLTGDRVLVEIARILKASFREGDRVVRYGGDEFVVVLPGVGSVMARSLAERARHLVDGSHFRSQKTEEVIDEEVSFSVGVAATPVDGVAGEEILAVADRRLYEEKQSRKGRHLTVRRPWRLLSASLGIVLLSGALSLAFWIRQAPPASVVAAQPSASILEARAEEQRRLQAELRSLELRVASLVEDLEAERSRVERERLAEELATVQGRLEEIGSVVEAPAPDSSVSELELVPAVVAVSPPPQPPEDGELPVTSDSELSPDPSNAPTSPPVPLVEEEMALAEDLLAPSAPIRRPPRLRERLEVQYPSAARHLRREATIRVRVLVDVQGHVVEAEAISGPQSLGFREAAVRAARTAVFDPALEDDEPVARETEIEVRFRLNERRR